MQSPLQKKKIFFFTYLFLAALGLHCCTSFCFVLFCFVLFSSYSKQGLLSSCSAWASHYGGFSCCGAQALECMGFRSYSTWAQ